MGFNLDVETTTFSAEDQSWLGSAHGTNNAWSGTLDASAFLATFTDGVVPSGVVLGRLTASPGKLVPYASAVNEVQTLNLGSATAGTITITFDGETTGSIAYNASAATVQTALEGLSNINPGDVVVTDGPLPGTVTLTFGGQYIGVNVPEITATPSGLTGGTVTIATTQQGGSSASDGSETAVGHLFTTTDLKGTTAGTAKDTVVPVIDHGRVIVANLPTGHGLTAAGRADLSQVRYVD